MRYERELVVGIRSQICSRRDQGMVYDIKEIQMEMFFSLCDFGAVSCRTQYLNHYQTCKDWGGGHHVLENCPAHHLEIAQFETGMT